MSNAISPTVRLVVRCIGCGAKKTVGPEQREQPCCDKCFMPMIPESASR
jgi:hypothetical protein